MSAPQTLPDGVCITTRLDDGRLRIDVADPRILISAFLLYEIADGKRSPWVSLGPEPLQRDHWDGHGFWEGALLKICGAGRTVVYRIGEYLPRIDGYIGEWPD